MFCCDHCCCCIPIPLTRDGGGSPIFPLVAHQTASPSIMASSTVTPAGSVHKSRGLNVVRCGCSLRDDVCYKWGIVVMNLS